MRGTGSSCSSEPSSGSGTSAENDSTRVSPPESAHQINAKAPSFAFCLPYKIIKVGADCSWDCQEASWRHCNSCTNKIYRMRRPAKEQQRKRQRNTLTFEHLFDHCRAHRYIPFHLECLLVRRQQLNLTLRTKKGSHKCHPTHIAVVTSHWISAWNSIYALAATPKHQAQSTCR